MSKFKLRVDTVEAVRLTQQIIIHREHNGDGSEIGNPGDWLVIDQGELKTFSDNTFRQRFEPADSAARAAVQPTSGMSPAGYKD